MKIHYFLGVCFVGCFVLEASLYAMDTADTAAIVPSPQKSLSCQQKRQLPLLTVQTANIVSQENNLCHKRVASASDASYTVLSQDGLERTMCPMSASLSSGDRSESFDFLCTPLNSGNHDHTHDCLCDCCMRHDTCCMFCCVAGTFWFSAWLKKVLDRVE